MTIVLKKINNKPLKKRKMKKILLQTLLILFGAISLIACDDDDEVFEGTDNRILSLVLTAEDGGKYTAAIVEDQIVFMIPDNVSLNGASVKYEISEQAILFPDPSTVDNWDQEQTFRVTAYNKSEREYSCVVKRVAVSANSVVLKNQADVDAFAQLGVSVIEGNLIIGENSHVSGDSIKDLSALSEITDVRYNIVVNNSYAGTKISMPKLRTAGCLVLGSMQSALKTAHNLEVEMPALEALGQLTVNSNTVAKLDLSSVMMITEIYIYSGKLAELNFSSLTECAGNLTLSSESYNNTNNSLQKLEIPELVKIQGNLSIDYMKALKDINLAKLQAIGSDCKMTYVALEKLNLPALQELRGSLTLTSGTNSLKSIKLPKLSKIENVFINDYSAAVDDIDFSSLAEVEGDFKVNYRGEMLEFPALSKVKGAIEFKRAEYMTSLKLPKLTDCKSLYLSDAKLMTSVDLSTISSMENLQIVSCYKLAELKVKDNALNNVELNGGSTLCDFTRIVGTDHINGKLDVANYNKNSELSFPGLKSIKEFKSNSGMSGQTLNFPDLEKLDKFEIPSATFLKKIIAPKLKEIGFWSTSFTSNVVEGDFVFPVLEKIGTFEFEGGTYSGSFAQMKLTNLNDFIHVTQIDKVQILGWGNLVDFSGLRNVISGMSESNWEVRDCKYNPTLDDMKAGKYVLEDASQE